VQEFLAWWKEIGSKGFFSGLSFGFLKRKKKEEREEQEAAAAAAAAATAAAAKAELDEESRHLLHTDEMHEKMLVRPLHPAHTKRAASPRMQLLSLSLGPNPLRMGHRSLPSSPPATAPATQQPH